MREIILAIVDRPTDEPHGGALYVASNRLLGAERDARARPAAALSWAKNPGETDLS